MRSGRLDRSIQIQAATTTQNDVGEPVDTWANLHSESSIPAAYTPQRGNERFSAQQLVGRAVVTFRVRYRDDVNTKCRIVYDGKNWDIHDVREIGRREGLDIDASARSED